MSEALARPEPVDENANAALWPGIAIVAGALVFIAVLARPRSTERGRTTPRTSGSSSPPRL
jgi:hypothetical protein